MTLFTRKNMVTSDLLYKGEIISLRVDKVVSDDKPVTREVIEHNGGVVIACQPELDQIVLVKQYRYSIDSNLIELPAGRLDIKELPLAAAKRELKEETGYQAKEWRQLCKMYTAPGFCNEILYLFHASEVTLTEKTPDHDEEIEVLILSLKEAWQKILNGEIDDAKTIAGIGLLINK